MGILSSGKAAIQYDVSIGGEARERKHNHEFSLLLKAQSVLFTKRRGSATVDEADFDDAFRFLIAEKRVDQFFHRLGAVLILFGGGFMSHGVNVVSNDPVKCAACFLGGAVMCLIGNHSQTKRS